MVEYPALIMCFDVFARFPKAVTLSVAKGPRAKRNPPQVDVFRTFEASAARTGFAGGCFAALSMTVLDGRAEYVETYGGRSSPTTSAREIGLRRTGGHGTTTGVIGIRPFRASEKLCLYSPGLIVCVTLLT